MMQTLKCIMALLCVLPVLVQADNTTQINLSGSLIEPPPCTINGGAPIVVDFGQVGISRVDGTNYAQNIDYQISCNNDPDNNPWVMGLTVLATPSGIGISIMKATIDGSDSTDLGIEMRLGGSYFPLNQRVEIKRPLPILQAIPYKRDGATLPEGAFHATATLLADYE
ncbi:fimbrial protein [Klebsiella aerogenes]|uniref:fimbrial protein n=1 Tax=Klebsiella aerogenes TaxID=548 RepID=UPI0013A5FCDD|nr:fimbrial protein [Klebsiella aerogenes]HCB2860477.1 fimbrial protein [Klebsiella aerogenes]HCB2865822.1 fimbrial protein [Klebsiella aerogenes]HCB2881711.1 fimbrial protein [Klebsiella aerogenes]HCB3346449.1 fimbrial protein [Klebsiella aerogenes]HCM1812545.1 fimbrial protein [Klebsiella aerogenes]